MSFDVPENDAVTVIAAAAGQTVLTADFPILSEAELIVERLRDGVATALTLGDDYTVVGVLVPAGFTVTLTTAALVRDVYALTRATTAARVDDRFSTGGAFNGGQINRSQDRLMLLLQEAQRDIGFALRVPPWLAPPPPLLGLGDRGTGFVTLDPAGNPIVRSLYDVPWPSPGNVFEGGHYGDADGVEFTGGHYG